MSENQRCIIRQTEWLFGSQIGPHHGLHIDDLPVKNHAFASGMSYPTMFFGMFCGWVWLGKLYPVVSQYITTSPEIAQ